MFGALPAVVTLLLVVVASIGLYILRVLQLRRAHWLSRRIPFAGWPHILFGNVRGIWSVEHSSTMQQRIYQALKERRLAAGGFNVFFSPSIMVVDPELIKQILVTDASVFDDRGLYRDKQCDPLNYTLFGSTGEVWHSLRDNAMRLLTAESVKGMFGLVAGVADELRLQMLKTIDRQRLDIHDLAVRYSTHVIGTSVFGIRCRTIQLASTEFREMGRRANECSPMVLFKQWLGVSFPRLSRMLGLKMIDSSVEEFFIGLCRATVLHRESYGVEKDDFLQSYIHLRRDQRLSMQELTAQCYSFVKNGLETCSSVMTFCLYELASAPAIQDRLRKEINHSLEDTDGQLTYEVINSMTYLDQVINETLRKYPPVDYLMRRSKTIYNHIPEGTLFIVPTYALHHDPDHFPNPERFDPERFALGAIRKRHPYSYLPFGAGPRNCIGVRFGAMLVKTGIVTMVRSFRFVRRGGDTGGVQFKPNSLVLCPTEGSMGCVDVQRI